MLERANSFDFDDTTIDRGAIVRGLGVVKAVARPSRVVAIPPISEIPNIDRLVVNERITNPIELFSFIDHSRRSVIPGVKEFMEKAKLEGYDNFGNTGRSNKKQWVEMTWLTLEKGGIADLVEDIYFTPDGVRTAVSKAEAIRKLYKRYKEVVHYEDDPRTAVILASLFPKMTIYLIQYKTSGLLYSRQEIEKYPGIKRIARIPG